MEVEALWEQMRAEPAPRALASLGMRSKKKPAAKAKGKAKQLDSTMGWASSWGVAVRERSVERTPVAVEVVEPPPTQLDALAQEESVVWTPDSFTSAVARDVNLLAEGSVQVRLESLQKLERVVVESLPTDVLDAALDLLLKPVLKRVSDPSERSREIAVRIVTALVEGASDREFVPCLAYVVPVLVARMACEDIDGIANLPEVMRPKPEQKPCLHYAIENSEEVRLGLAQLVRALLQRMAPFQQLLLTYIDEVVGVCRAQAMDPFAAVKAVACENMELLCYQHYEMLLHFTLAMGRSLCSCLVHNHARMKIAGLRAITAVFKCGVWKHNHEVIQHLVAWQDPNLVPVKAFYDPLASTTVNYFASLTFAQSPAVRRFWFETLAYWLLRVEDKVDHEPHIFPYLLSGLFDENVEIALEVFWLLERVGEMYEEQEEKDLRDERQYGFELAWTYNGRGFCPFPTCGQWRLRGENGVPLSPYRRKPSGPDHRGTRTADRVREAEIELGEPLEVPARNYSWPLFRDLEVFPVLPRPRLGSRHYVRKHTRRYIKALFNNVTDFRDCTAMNAAQLLMVTIAYTEEGVTEWIHDINHTIVRFYAGKAAMGRSAELVDVYDRCCAQLGAFLDANALWAQARDAFDPASIQAMPERVATVEIYTRQLRGGILVLGSLDDPAEKWGKLTEVIPDILETFLASDLLFEAPAATREVLWGLLLELLTPELRPWYSAEQVTKLLCLGVTIAASPPPQLRADLLALQSNAQEMLAQAQWADPKALDELFGLLAKIPAAPAQDGAGLLGAGFLALLEFADFPSFRALAEIAPVSVLHAAEHAPAFLERLESFCATGSEAGTRVLALGVAGRIVARCLVSEDPEARSLANEVLARTVPPVLAGMQDLLPVLSAPAAEEDGVLVEELDKEMLEDGVLVEEVAVPAASGGLGADGPVLADSLDMDALDDEPAFCPPPRAAAEVTGLGVVVDGKRTGGDAVADFDHDFAASPAFKGPRPGWIFTTRAQGTGYYRDQALEEVAEADLDDLDELDGDEPGQALVPAAAKTAPAPPPAEPAEDDDGDEDVEKLPLLVASTPYVVLASALAVLQRAVAPAPAGFLRPADWWKPLVTLAGDSSLHTRLRAALERGERAARGLDAKADLAVKTSVGIRSEADKRADRARCSAISTLLLAGAREGWPAELLDALRPLFGALSPSVDDVPSDFRAMQNFFMRGLPSSVALYLAALLRHAVAPKHRGVATMRDDAPRTIARIDMKRTAVSRLRGAAWPAEEQRRALESTVGALLELNLILPPDPEARNVPAQSTGQQLGVAADGTGLFSAEVDKIIGESDEALRWNAALVLTELACELVRQFTVPAIELHRDWGEAGMHGRVFLLDDILRRSVTLPGAEAKR